MGNDELYLFNMVKEDLGEEVLKQAMEMTTQDIKFNRVGFGKKTSTKQFMNIFFSSVDICLRC